MSTTHTTSAPKERPILFSAPMVRAILEGRKTQTRRIIKHPPPAAARIWHDGAEWNVENANADMWLGRLTCPYGSPGDRLWVRETWAKQLDGKFTYRADTEGWELSDYTATGRWKPSIHMPRASARILLEITDIRAERLHYINEYDAIAEGVEATGTNIYGQAIYKDYYGDSLRGAGWSSALRSYLSLWEKINGASSWDANPWVWAITFKKIEP